MIDQGQMAMIANQPDPTDQSDQSAEAPPKAQPL